MWLRTRCQPRNVSGSPFASRRLPEPAAAARSSRRAPDVPPVRGADRSPGRLVPPGQSVRPCLNVRSLGAVGNRWLRRPDRPVLEAGQRPSRGPGAVPLRCIANGGYMPASPAAAAAVGHSATDTYSNSAIVDGAALAPLTDIFALPTWLPFSNVFSLGDVLIAAGIAAAIA